MGLQLGCGWGQEAGAPGILRKGERKSNTEHPCLEKSTSQNIATAGCHLAKERGKEKNTHLLKGASVPACLKEPAEWVEGDFLLAEHTLLLCGVFTMFIVLSRNCT